MSEFQEEFDDLCKSVNTVDSWIEDVLQKKYGVKPDSLDMLQTMKFNLKSFISEIERALLLIDREGYPYSWRILRDYLNDFRATLKETEAKIEKGDYQIE